MTYQHGLLAIEFRARVAMRSPMLGMFYSGVMSVGQALGLEYHSAILPGCKAVHALICATLPCVIYLCVVQQARGRHRAWFRRVGLVSAFLVAGGEYFVHKAAHTISNSVVSPAVFYALWAWAEPTPHTARRLLGGGLLGLALYLRPDTAVVAGTWVCVEALGSGQLSPKGVSRRQVGAYVVGFALALALGAGCDRAFYGFWVITPYNWVKLNLFQGVAAIHGVQPSNYYYEELIAAKAGPWAVLVLGGITLWAAALRAAHGDSCTPKVRHRDPLDAACEEVEAVVQEALRGIPKRFEKDVVEGGAGAHVEGPVEGRWSRISFAMRVGGAACAVAGVYSLLGHKELRFVHDALLLWQLFAAQSMALLSEDVVALMASLTPFLRGKRLRGGVCLGLTALLAVTYVWDGWRSRDVKDWHEFEHMNRAMAFVGKQPDATGLILTGFWWDTAGYTAVHKAIPVVYAVDDESLEVKPDPMAMLGYACDANFPDKFSPTYWEYAKKGVVHVYLSMAKYNYLAVPNTEKNTEMAGTFRSFGFTKVYSFPKAAVYYKPA